MAYLEIDPITKETMRKKGLAMKNDPYIVAHHFPKRKATR